jgi:ribosomal protein S18 acetylase RimI-like enzyme
LNVEGTKDPKVGAIVCFVVAPDQRRQGIATTLLEAALEHLRKRGMTTAEAYPVLGEIDPRRWSQINYVGPLSMYVKAGFEVVEKNDDRAVVRRTL